VPNFSRIYLATIPGKTVSCVHTMSSLCKYYTRSPICLPHFVACLLLCSNWNGPQNCSILNAACRKLQSFALLCRLLIDAYDWWSRTRFSFIFLTALKFFAIGSFHQFDTIELCRVSTQNSFHTLCIICIKNMGKLKVQSAKVASVFISPFFVRLVFFFSYVVKSHISIRQTWA